MHDCEFCRIVRKGAQAATIYEDEDTLAFLNIRPIRAGHTLVIPKSHWEDIYQMETELYVKMMHTVQICGNFLNHAFSADKIEFLKSGWEVPHVHIHILPTYRDDDITTALKETIQEVSFQELYQIAELIRNKSSLL